MDIEPLSNKEQTLEHWISCLNHYNLKKVPLIDVANFHEKIYSLCVSEGKDYAYVAKRLGISKGRLSKYLKFNAAPDIVKSLSTENKIVDVEALYILASIVDKDIQAVTEFIYQWKNKEISGSIRPAVKRLACLINKKHKGNPETDIEHKKILDISIINTGDQYLLTLKNSIKQISFNIDSDFFSA